MFSWDNYNDKLVLEKITVKPEIDDIRYVDGALIWKVDRRNITRNGMMKLVGTELYKNLTIRNCNTVRKIKKRLSG
tara:strand:- start:1639 stop:1866 length:228 start_codon:yes stop_codon:yes gene_type:complete